MGLISLTVSEINGDIGRKSQIFPPPAVFCAPAEEVALGIGYQSWGSKTIVRHIYGTTGPRNKFDIFSCVDTMHQRDGRTDGRTDTGRQQRPRLRIAWRGNQTCCQSLPTADRRHWKNKLSPLTRRRLFEIDTTSIFWFRKYRRYYEAVTVT